MRKLIVVTGGSKGIGRAIIEKFMEEGFDAVTCARDQAGLESMRNALRKTYPGSEIFTHVADLSGREEAMAFAAQVRAMNRPVDVLVNNAGYFVPGAIATEPDGNLESMVGANLYSAYHTTRGLVGDMKRRRSGHIFNICSVASLKAYDNGGSYAISKAALLGFSRCLREELKNDHIRVTAVMPGATKTRSWESAGLPDDRFIKAADVALTVYSAYALSPAAVVEEIILRPLPGDI